MAGSVVLLDTSVLIDYFRKKDKASTLLHELALSDAVMKLSVITEYEFLLAPRLSSIHIGTKCWSIWRYFHLPHVKCGWPLCFKAD
jgi:predicted nucleic acid-binding protein